MKPSHITEIVAQMLLRRRRQEDILICRRHRNSTPANEVKAFFRYRRRKLQSHRHKALRKAQTLQQYSPETLGQILLFLVVGSARNPKPRQ